MSEPPIVFISYSHVDARWKERLATQLKVLQRQGLLQIWDDSRIGPADPWRAVICAALESSQAAVLLVSADFLASDFIGDQEVPLLLRRRSQEGLLVMPVILRPCAWTRVTWLAEMQVRPRGNRALLVDEHTIDEAALAEIVDELVARLPQPLACRAESVDSVRLAADGSPLESDCRAVEVLIEDLGGDVTLELVEVPSGMFLMGSPGGEEGREKAEGPQRPVEVEGFAMARYPVTQAQWRVIAAEPTVSRPLSPKPSHFAGDERPVERVSWNDAREFCARLSRRSRRFYRLPSEAEWEYACRAGTTGPFPFGATVTTDCANFDGASSYAEAGHGHRRGATTPVASLRFANGHGLFDMSGNVWEWCQDVWHDTYEGAPPDHTPWEASVGVAYRVARGGSWVSKARECRSASRGRYRPEETLDTIGFRVVTPMRSRRYALP